MLNFHASLRPLALVFAFTLLACLAPQPAAHAQESPFENRPVREVRLEGLSTTPERLVRNQIRITPGDPFNERVRQEDIVRLNYLGRFTAITSREQATDDGGVIVTYRFTESPTLVDVQTVGNKYLTDQDLQAVLILRAGDPVDEFLIDRAVQQIQQLYQSKGYFAASVSVDQDLLDEENVLLLRVTEGPRVRVRGILYQGNDNHPARQLASQVRSRTHIPILRSGVLDRDLLTRDVDRLRTFLRGQGYLDAQVGRQIDFSPDGESAVITFLINEGPQYRLGELRIEGVELFPREQIELAMAVQPGGVMTQSQLAKSVDNLRELYGKLGYIDVTVDLDPVFRGDQPVTDLRVLIKEGRTYTVGKVIVRGNELTKTKVVLRELRGLTPGRPFDLQGLERTRRRFANSPYFSEGSVTVLGEEGDPIRDILVEVKEKNTGNISLGVGASSDIGLIGNFSVTQRNFDITDFPESWGEFVSNKAFRGGGQVFNLTLQPGNEYNRYSVGWRDPYFLETDYFLDVDFSFFNRERRDYDEGRINVKTAMGKRFGDQWSASVSLRGEKIDISEIDDDASLDVFEVEGGSSLTAVGFDVSRSTLDSGFFPTRGSKVRFGIEQVGLAGGDYDFTRLDASYTKYWTLGVDFLNRKEVLTWRVEGGWILGGDAPVFERFYAGGHRSLRGFANRGAGPVGIRADTLQLGDEPVGGEFRLTQRVEYTFPVRDDFLRWAVFTDMGTVLDDPGFDDWRVAIGTGARFNVPLFGNAPFAFDFTWPILKEDFDDTQIISFDAAIPFN